MELVPNVLELNGEREKVREDAYDSVLVLEEEIPDGVTALEVEILDEDAPNGSLRSVD